MNKVSVYYFTGVGLIAVSTGNVLTGIFLVGVGLIVAAIFVAASQRRF